MRDDTPRYQRRLRSVKSPSDGYKVLALAIVEDAQREAQGRIVRTGAPASVREHIARDAAAFLQWNSPWKQNLMLLAQAAR